MPVFSTLKLILLKKQADFKNDKQVTFPPPTISVKLLQHLFLKELRLLARKTGLERFLFLYKKQYLRFVWQDSRRTGKKVKQGSREERKNCQIKTPRKQIPQYQDLQKKMFISIMTRGRRHWQLKHYSRDCLKNMDSIS